MAESASDLLDSAPAPSVSLQAAGALLLLAVAAFLRGPITRWVQARAEREERSRRTAEHKRQRDESDPPDQADRTADVHARIREIDRSRIRPPQTWEAEWDERMEEKVARLRQALASLEVRVNELATEQNAMKASWQPVLELVQTLARSIEERLVVCPHPHPTAAREEHGPPTWRPGDRPRSDR